jgi:polyisoprenoid-binding protein YceI
MTSIKTGSEERDHDLKSPDYIDRHESGIVECTERKLDNGLRDFGVLVAVVGLAISGVVALASAAPRSW